MYRSSYLTLLHSRSTNTLSNARPRPSRLTAIPASSKRPVYSRDVNWEPWSVLKISGPSPRQRLVQRLEAEPPFQGVGKPPREHVPTVPVDHCGQIHEPTPHRDVGNVRTPDFVCVGQFPIAKQVRVDPRVRCCGGSPRSGKQRFQAHFRHEPLDPLAIDRLPGSLQTRRHPSAAVERGQQELLVDQPHQAQVLLGLDGRLEIVARTVEIQKFALPTDAQMSILCVDQGSLEISRSGQLFFSTTRPPS